MADFDDATVVRELAPSDIGTMTNPQLKHALKAILGAERGAEPSNGALLEELRSLREEMAEMKALAKKVEYMSDRLEKAHEIIHNQQLFLETLDYKERNEKSVLIIIVLP